jgi:hypothetical protein
MASVDIKRRQKVTAIGNGLHMDHDYHGRQEAAQLKLLARTKKGKR